MSIKRVSAVAIVAIMVTFSILSNVMLDAYGTKNPFQLKKVRSKDHMPAELEKHLTDNLKNLRKDIESKHRIHL